MGIERGSRKTTSTWQDAILWATPRWQTLSLKATKSMTALDDRVTFSDEQQVVDGPLAEDDVEWLEPVPQGRAGATANVPPLVRASRAVAVAITVGIATQLHSVVRRAERFGTPHG